MESKEIKEEVIEEKPKGKNHRKTTNEALVKRKYLPFHVAKYYVQSLNLSCEQHFQRWHRENKPVGMPKFPWRVYKEWVSWGDFLGTGSVQIPYKEWTAKRRAKIRKQFRSYWEASLLVQKLNIKSAEEYRYYKKENLLPDDMPFDPYITYSDEWEGWKKFFGKTPSSKVETIKNIDKFFAIAGVPGHPANYIQLIIAHEGYDDLKEQLNVNAFRVYDIENNRENELKEIMSKITTHQNANVYLCHNVSALFFELDNSFIFRKDIGDQIFKEKFKKPNQTGQ